MELSIENLARAAFPRTAAAQGAKMPRRLLSGIMDAASFPGRTLMAAADATGPTMTLGDIIANQSIPANSTDFLSSMGRTGAMPGRSRVDAISESIIRDPISVLGLGTGSLAKAVGGKVAAATGNKVAPKLASYVADLLANSGTDAASQYATTGAIDPRQMALGAGLGLGMQGLGAGVMKMAKAKPIRTIVPGAQQREALSRIANDPVLLEEFTDRLMEVVENHNGSIGIRGQSIPVSVGHKYTPSRRWIDGAPTEEILNGSSSIGIAGDWASLNYKRSKDAIKSALEKSAMYGEDFHVIAGDFGRGGEDIGEIVIPKAKSVFSLSDFIDKNRDAFNPTDPNIARLTGGGTQLPSLQLPGFAKRLGSRYMNDTTATSGRH